MDSTPAGLDFAVIGHQDSWQNIARFFNAIRVGQEILPVEKIKTSFSFIPPRDIFRVQVKSTTGAVINGVYIETFIDPDKLDAAFARANISKVMQAIAWAKKMQAKIVALGGFTSIVLEGNFDSFAGAETKFTTGNTLTAAFIVKAIEKAAMKIAPGLSAANVLIIGATGDIGSACVHYLKHKVSKLLLCARNQHRLEQMAHTLEAEHIAIEHAVAVAELVPAADIIICVASDSGIQLGHCKKNVIICDAGYPKNLDQTTVDGNGIHLFHGGMGQVGGGFNFDPDYSESIYQYPPPCTIHGCILEAMVLAFEKRVENYSCGKGNISSEKMEEIYNMALKHGIDNAPFYNANGLW